MCLAYDFHFVLLFFGIWGSNFTCSLDITTTEDSYGVRLPNACEACKIFAAEFMDRFEETASSETLRLGSDDSAKSIPYATSEIRLVEILSEPDLCIRMLQYRLHKERKDSTRFEKTTPQTFEVLKELMDRGVNVKTDVPHELWDTPSAEIIALQRLCQTIISVYEDEIEDWFFNYQDKESFDQFLCAKHILKNTSSACLSEKLSIKPQLVSSSSSSAKEDAKTEL